MRDFFGYILIIFFVGIKGLYANDPDPEQNFIINRIIISGNKTTKEKVILRELTFAEGDTIQFSDIMFNLEKSKENLLKTPLFNYVTIDYTIIDIDKIDISIIVEERWYTWPQFGIEYADRNFSAWLAHKDFNRINYSFGIEKYNFRGLNEKIKFSAQFGYNKHFIIAYSGLYFDKKRKHSLSIFFKYATQNKVAYLTKENQLLYYSNGINKVISNTEFSIQYTYRPNIDNMHNLFIRRYSYDVDDTIKLLNPDFFGNSRNKCSFYFLLYEYIRDKRDNRSYPLSGSYSVFKFAKYGFGTTFDSLNLANIVISNTNYFEITDRLHAASTFFLKFSLHGVSPYFLRDGLGYNTYLNGYEYYVVDGQHYGYTKALFKYTVIPTVVHTFDFIPLTKFKKVYFAMYANIFANIGYVSDITDNFETYNNSLANTWLYSAGLGIDLVTYYDKVFRIEYSINKNKEGGLFLHFKSFM